MKIILISFFVLSTIFAKSGFTLTGGYNMSKIKVKDDNNLLDNFDYDYRGGFNIGLEKHADNLIVGASFLQRGSMVKDPYSNSYVIVGFDSYNYGAAHLLFPTNLGYGFEVFGGIQAGLSLGGSATRYARTVHMTENIGAAALNFDAGSLLGANYMINERIGLRASYYLGLTDVSIGVDDDANYKNNTFSFSVLVNASASLANQKAQIEKQKALDENGSAQDAHSEYNLVYGKQFHQTILAENLHSVFHLYDYLDSYLVPKTNVFPKSNYGKVINPIFRLSKLFFTNYLLGDYILTMNHELGHGYRMIEAGGSIIEITYNLPPPFSNDFSWIDLNTPINFTEQQNLMVLLGGSESNLIFSDLMRKNILLDQKFNYNFSWPYLYSSGDMPGYTAFITNPNGDPIRYRRDLNALYGDGKEVLTRKKMINYSLLALYTDPMNYYALKAVFYDYVIKGKNSSKVKMINLKNGLQYLPRFRFEYTPYGPELVYQNYFKFDSTLMQFSFSHSDSELPDAWRFAANIWNIKSTDKLSFNFSGQIWNQPEIKFYQNDKLKNVDGLGGKIVGTINYEIFKNKHLYGLTFHIGYKSNGYSLGEPLNEGLIVRSGLFFKLGNN
jgi:hypothetical protein